MVCITCTLFVYLQGIWTLHGVSTLPHLFGCSTDVSANHNAAYMAHCCLWPVLDLCTFLGIPHFEQLSVQSVQEENSVAKKAKEQQAQNSNLVQNLALVPLLF